MVRFSEHEQEATPCRERRLTGTTFRLQIEDLQARGLLHSFANFSEAKVRKQIEGLPERSSGCLLSFACKSRCCYATPQVATQPFDLQAVVDLQHLDLQGWATG